MSPDTEAARTFFRQKKRALTNKLMSVKEAVERFVKDGDYIASGGFGTNRIATAILHEILRQRKRNLGFAGHTSTHDFQIIAAGNLNGEKLLARLDLAYVIGLEVRGLSPHGRRVVESGAVELCEWTNYALACRLRAAAAGIPFLPSYTMLGTDTFRFSAAKVIDCPFTHRKVVALPALYPDVGIIHVHAADCYGNCRIRGISVADFDLARASKRVIVSVEHLVSNDDIRSAPDSTMIPAFCVDAVCEVPFGSYPGNMPGEYFSDEEHLRLWLQAEKNEAEFSNFVKKYILDVPDFESYLQLCGGMNRIRELRALELLVPMEE
jgi:glutaconate CoA-transferase subunit A